MLKRILIIVAVVLLGAAAFWGAGILREGQASGEGDLVAYGNVEIREVNLGFRVGGRVAALHVEEGDAVEPGELLAELDGEPKRIALRLAEAALEGARAERALLEAGFRQEEIAQAEAKLSQAQAALERTGKEFRRQRQLRQSDASTQQRLDQAESAYEEAVAQKALARASLDLLEAGFREEEIAAARARVDQAEAERAARQLAVEDTRLKAPAGGVIRIRAVEPGALVGAGQTVLTLSLLDRTWVRAYLPEPQLGKIHPGMRAEVFTDSNKEKPYLGQIGFISPRAEFTPKNVETEELRTDLIFRFRVILEDPDAGLRQGMPVTVKLLEGEGDRE